MDPAEAPALTPELRDRMIEGCLRAADGRSVAELERLRDGFLAELLTLVERYAVTARTEPAGPLYPPSPRSADVILDTRCRASLRSA